MSAFQAEVRLFIVMLFFKGFEATLLIKLQVITYDPRTTAYRNICKCMYRVKELLMEIFFRNADLQLKVHSIEGRHKLLNP